MLKITMLLMDGNFHVLYALPLVLKLSKLWIHTQNTNKLNNVINFECFTLIVNLYKIITQNNLALDS